ncbi:MAG: hypothetical protein OEW87_13640, partial [Flavobacteriaceae bacterium]|nr:hypothetical protein [Flavobacteriaceae bacterium]
MPMNNDFPFNHFINLGKNVSNNSTLDNSVKSAEFPIILNRQDETNVNSAKKGSLTDVLFDDEELSSISNELLIALKKYISAQKYKAFF